MIEFVGKGSASPAAGTSVVNSVDVDAATGIMPGTVVYFVVHNLGTLATGVSGLGATWTRIASRLGTGVGVEVWMGVDPTATGNVTTTFAVSTKASYTWTVVVQAGTKAGGTAAVNSGSSVTVDPGTVTPAVGDVVIVAETHANVTAASGVTDTPVAPNGYAQSASTAATGTTGQMAWRQANATTATKRTFTITSAQWAAVAVAVTGTVTAFTGADNDPDPQTAGPQDPLDAHVYRGQDTKALDDAGSY